jgi:hypothetical protein
LANSGGGRFTLSEVRGGGAIMIVVKTLWASVQGDPVFMRRVNGWLALFWIAMIPVSLETGWVKSVVYVSALSLWALVSGHWSAWQAARVEVNQDLEAKKRSKEDVAQDVVDKIVDDTDVSASP